MSASGEPAPSPAEEAAPRPVPPAQAGAVCWRISRSSGRQQLEVLLLHEGGGAWRLPRAEAEAGEALPECAVRAVGTATGRRVRLGRLLDGGPAATTWWAARPFGRYSEDVTAGERAWWPSVDALTRLDAVQRAPVEALLGHLRSGTLDTRPLLVLRHAKARPRSSWSRAEADRPLVALGRRQALLLAPLLACWQPRFVLTSSWRRCTETVAPYAAAWDPTVRGKRGLSEEGFSRNPRKAAKHLRSLLGRDEASLLCTHRPVLPALLRELRARADSDCAAVLESEHDPYLEPAEFVVAHVSREQRVGRDGQLRRAGEVLAAERHRPLPGPEE